MSGLAQSAVDRSAMHADELDAQTPETEIAAFIDRTRRRSDGAERLVELLREEHGLYRGRSANETARIRGYTLASFERTGLPDAAWAYVLEELESGREPYLVAAAAIAARGARPTSELVPYLLCAVENIRLRDDALTFEVYRPRWPLPRRTTALTELVRTCGWLGPLGQDAIPALEAMCDGRAGEFSAAIRGGIRDAIQRIRDSSPGEQPECCGLLSAVRLPVRSRRTPARRHADVSAVLFEDQDGARLNFDAHFRGKPSIVVFFYTRCDNPNKCSLSITRLADLQEAIHRRGLDGRIRTAAITYDPAFDCAVALKQYGRNRGVIFGSDDRMLRAARGFTELRAWFQLGVNFGPATVNRHRLELFVLDARGEIAATFTRLRWDNEAVLDEAVRLLPGGANDGAQQPKGVAGRSRGAVKRAIAVTRTMGRSPAVPGLLLAILPKCPLCWAAYAGALGIAPLAYVPYSPWLHPLLIVLLVVGVAAMGVRAARSRRVLPVAAFALASGGAILLSLTVFSGLQVSPLVGASLIAIAAVVNSLAPAARGRRRPFYTQAAPAHQLSGRRPRIAKEEDRENGNHVRQ